MHKAVSIALASVAVAGSGLAVAAMNPLHLAAAQQAPATTAAPTTTAAPGTAAAPGSAATPRAPFGRGALVQQVLDDLVKKGTITADQAKAITDALQTAAKNQPHGSGRGPGFGFGNMATTVATAIGISEADLRTALQGGATIAKVAQDHKVDPQKVIDALTAEAGKKIDAAVTAGKLTADQAATAKTHAADMAKNVVNGTGPMGGHMGPGFGGLGGFGGRGGPGQGRGPGGRLFPGVQVPSDAPTTTVA